MANIGINLPPSEIGATNANTWHIPVDSDGDTFGPLEEYFRDPLRAGCPTPAFITFPSLKVDFVLEYRISHFDNEHVSQDKSHGDQTKTCCQMLLMAEYDWFKQYIAKDANTNHYFIETGNDRLAGYDACKEMWKQRCLDIFLKYFPKVQHSDGFRSKK